MTVSPGNLDSLLNETFPVADYTGVSLQSETGATVPLGLSGGTYSTVTLNTTGVPGPGAVPDEVLDVTGVNDSDNSISISLSLSGSLVAVPITEYILGYSPEGLLVGTGDLEEFAIGISGMEGPISALDTSLGVLSSTPIPAQTNISFSSSGGTPPPGEVILHGSSSQYIVADDNGSLYVQDTVAGRDGTQTLPGVTEMVFTDGTGVFDPTGTAEDVARIYGATLGRGPDVAGLEYWTAQVDDSNVPLSVVASSFTTSPEFIQDYGSLSDGAFVNQLYENVLGRAADASGAQYWDGVLASGASRGTVVLGFAESQENETKTISTAGDVDNAEAYRLYQAALDRAPDASGLSYWSSTLANGVTPTQVAQNFISSAEFLQDYGTLSASDFVSTLYQNVLHRAADPTGLQYWTNALQQGASEASVLVGFSDSLENRVNTASATHANWVFIPS
jgi:hypothetical protein